ncbi:hypothetical protein HMSSN036_03160 [Paenibacillus macerans]|nr:hypothetical protein HMSSN036_03160 [Paenibacillus macerans]
MAMSAGIGCFVADNFTELHMLQALAAEKGIKVNVLLRVTPGVEAHTHEYISTGQTDSKFGFDIGNGSAFEAVELASRSLNLNLLGFIPISDRKFSKRKVSSLPWSALPRLRCR